MKEFLNFFCLLAIIAVVSAARSKSQYCDGTCEHPLTHEIIQHIGCYHNNLFDPIICPKNANMVPITDQMKKILVDAHNEKRNFIAGGGDVNHWPACRMATMTWDDELAKLAALNVKQCEMSHDYCHNTVAFEYSGQSLSEAWHEPPGPFNNAVMLRNAVEGWFEEVKNCRQHIIDSYPENYNGPKIGHFTVMMAERNTHVGCSAATYTKGRRSYCLVACNYATNNIFNKPIYKKCKTAGTSCSSGRNFNYRNLCSLNERYEVNKW